jgi:Cellulase M and related proteins
MAKKTAATAPAASKNGTASASLPDLELLRELIALPGPAGDEAPVAAFLEGYLAANVPEAQVERIQDSLIVRRGTPKTAIFAHTDTTGFTLGYDNHLIPIGGPQPADGDRLKCTSRPECRGRVRLPKVAGGKRGGGEKRGPGPRLARVEGGAAEPGTRWVYAAAPEVDTAKGTITSPYLDDRAGVWAGLQALKRCPNIAVAFCTGEEQHGHGARVCAERLYREYGITQALIADITWHTDDTPCGKGVVISLRDQFSPRQAFLDRVLAEAGESGIPFQREIQSAGSSDGGHILRSSVPLDWVFIGAPEKRPHTAKEQAHLSDLAAMADLFVHLIGRL